MSDDEFKNLIASHSNYTECLRELGLSATGSCSRQVIKKRIKELSIDTSHFSRRGKKKTISYRYPLDDILCKNSFYGHSKGLKDRLVRAGLLEYKCAFCGNTGKWNNKALVLQLDHINGDHFDNRLENLRLLCPNCHSQTKTYAGKNARKSKDFNENDKREGTKADCKENLDEKNLDRIKKIQNANINFSCKNWAKKVNEFLGFTYLSHVPKWLRKYMPEEYQKTWNNSVASRVNIEEMVKEYCETDISLRDLAKKNNIAEESARSILAKDRIHNTSRKPFSNKNAAYYHRKIEMCDDNGKYVFESMKDVEDYLLDKGIVTLDNKNRVKINIGRCLNGARKTAFGKKWKVI